MFSETVEYKVRPVTRFVVTKFTQQQRDLTGTCGQGQSSQCGEYDNEVTAYAVGYALCKADHDRLGYPIGDERVKYPEPVTAPTGEVR